MNPSLTYRLYLLEHQKAAALERRTSPRRRRRSGTPFVLLGVWLAVRAQRSTSRANAGRPTTVELSTPIGA